MKIDWSQLFIIEECRRLRWHLWQCPPFLFVVLGCVTIGGILASYFLAVHYAAEPHLIALTVLVVTVILFVLGNLIIHGFNQVAEANRMKSEFISIISHQLRSPLSIFKWTLNMLERAPHHNALPHDFVLTLDTLRNTTENMIKLVNSLLEVSRIEAQTLLLRDELFSLAEVTSSSLHDFQHYADASHITLRFHPPAHIPQVRGDRERIAIVIENLLSNAIHYTKGAGTITIAITQENGVIKWNVHDEGVGIPKNDQPYIFEKFFRAGNTRTHQINGSGIGLYIAKAITEASGGEIGFSSRDGRGSIFWFSLPIAKDSSGLETRIAKDKT
ncbi:MAG: PAS/PAC sensor hybrid histidine kinase [Parcubacteria group bacterium Gr01-1014_66]|nr:MAG: PAS/PAC sensor hybrid histidine kinase [Parcubacteria group bacterium Gr01-1014_66]